LHRNESIPEVYVSVLSMEIIAVGFGAGVAALRLSRHRSVHGGQSVTAEGSAGDASRALAES
jgi:hypothetical protein